MLFGSNEYTYELVDGWAKLPDGWSFGDVGGVAVDAQDRVYVLSRGTRPAMVFDRDGNLLASWGEGLFARPHGICLGPDGAIYCTDDGNHTVSKFTADGTRLLKLGTVDQPSDTGYVQALGTASVKRGGPPFNRPTGVALSAAGEIFISDGYGNARVHKFSPDGTLLSSWGEPGTAPGQFRQPHSAWVDRLGRVWICDRDNSRIQIFGDNGDFLSEWADIGGKPSDVFLDYSGEGTVYVAVKSGERPHGVSIFTMGGKLLARWGSTEGRTTMFWSPHAIAVDSRGDIYLGEIRHEMRAVDRGSRALSKFTRKG